MAKSWFFNYYFNILFVNKNSLINKVFLDFKSLGCDEIRMSNTSSWWFFDLGRRLWLGLEFLLWPLKVLALLIECAVGGVFLGAIAVVIAWWYNWIPDQDLIVFVNELGGRALTILQMQTVFHTTGMLIGGATQ